MSIYQSSVLKKFLKQQDPIAVSKAYKKFTKYFHNPETQDNIRAIKEEGFQQKFLMELFVNVFGYTINPDPKYNLTTEFKNLKGAKKADGAVLQNGKAHAVIELKSTKTKDLEKIRQQAFDYKANHPGCVYVVTSNFEKIRFYINNAVDFEEFDLFLLTEERFELLYLCLHKENLLQNVPLKIKEASIHEEEAITKKFYADYSLFKRELFRDLVKQNMRNDVFRNVLASEETVDRADKNIKLTLFKKSQKLLDRFLFIFFGEDRGLLPPNSIPKILEQWQNLKEMDAYSPLYERYQKYFSYLNEGWKGKEQEIFAYNGGLFKPDPILDSIVIDDELLYKHTSTLTKYDFESQVDVNILGHIFENSLNEIESVNAEIEGVEFDKQKTKRKKDGVFYTPKYITKYIVDKTLGKLCEEKKAELGVVEDEYLKGRKNRPKATIEKLDVALNQYREWLLQLTICDPACGSGAFLNQALEFLITEHRWIDEMSAKLLGGAIVFQDIENSILENNIYGVDLNEESVEIAKLSLWLRTAQKGRKLTSLNSNIKCGNSLIDSKSVAGDKAFNWGKEFPEVFAQGGFDVIIGNPPYVIVFDNAIKSYLEDHYTVFKRNNDLYAAFYGKSLEILKQNGLLGFITPNSFVKGDYFKGLRELFASYQINSIVDFTNYLVFEDANVFSAIIILSKSPAKEDWYLYLDLDTKKGAIKSGSADFIPENKIQKKLSSISKFDDLLLIKDVGFNYWSIGRGKVRGESIGSRILYAGEKLNNADTPYIKGSNFNRYTGITLSNYLRHNYQEFLNENDVFRFSPEILEVSPKLIYRQTSSKLVGTLDYNKNYCDKTVHVIINRDGGNIDLRYVLAIFNSKLLNYMYSLLTEESGRAFAQVKTVNVKKLPLLIAENHEQTEIIEMVNDILQKGNEFSGIIGKFSSYILKHTSGESTRKMQSWYDLEFVDFIKEFNKAIKKSGGDKLSKAEEIDWLDVFETKKKEALELKAQIDKKDSEIDQKVYQLYELNQEDIEIIEGQAG